MKAGDTILVGARGLQQQDGPETLRRGRVALVYPQIDQGRVIADAVVEGLGDYFVGERTRVYVATGTARGARRAGRTTSIAASASATSGSRTAPRWSSRSGCRSTAASRSWPASRRGDVVVRAMKLGLSGDPDAGLHRLAADAALPGRRAVVGALALLALPREEEPQISVPMVDILVTANGYKAGDAIELITKPLEDIVKGINGVEHVYSSTQDDSVVVTARFFVGTDEDTALLRIHEKIRANIADLPKGIPEPLIIGRGINDVAIVTLTLEPKPAACGALDGQRALPDRRGAAARAGQGRQCRPELHRRRQPQPDPRRARSGAAGALRHHAQPARRQAVERQPLVPGRRLPPARPERAGGGRPDPAGRARHRPAAAHLARRPAGLRQGRGHVVVGAAETGHHSLDLDAHRVGRAGAAADGHAWPSPSAAAPTPSWSPTSCWPA